MGITNCGRHKRSKTGGKRAQMQKKRKNVMGRQPSNTRVGVERVRDVRVRGGNTKSRALRLSQGEFTFHSTGFTATSPIEQVMYHPSCNELMRTNTLTKSAVVKIKSEPFSEEVKKANIEDKDKVLAHMANKGFFYALITSRPGQEGVANGYILQGEELDFFQNKLKKGKIIVE